MPVHRAELGSDYKAAVVWYRRCQRHLRSEQLPCRDERARPALADAADRVTGGRGIALAYSSVQVMRTLTLPAGFKPRIPPTQKTALAGRFTTLCRLVVNVVDL